MARSSSGERIEQKAEAWPGASTAEWDEVDEAGWESFPASDPPALCGDQSPKPTAVQRPISLHTHDSSEHGGAALTTAERRALLEALEDEYQAWATYDRVIADFGPERPFINIRDSEARHIGALQALFRRYGLDIPANT